jgi:hypothetical protein
MRDCFWDGTMGAQGGGGSTEAVEVRIETDVSRSQLREDAALGTVRGRRTCR